MIDRSGPQDAGAGGLPKVVGWAGVALYTAGYTVGSGIFRVPSDVARYAGSSTWMTLLWLGGSIFVAASSVFFLELAIRLPRSGGKVVYLREAFGPGVAFVYGVAGLLFLPAAAAAVARTFADYLGALLPLSEAALRAVAALILALHTAIAIRSTRLVTRLISVATVAKIAALLFVLWAALAHALPLRPAAPAPFMPPSPTALMLGFIPVVWAFSGSESAIWIAGEIRNPGRNLLIGMIGGVAIVAALYVFLSLGFVHVLGFAGVARSTAVAAEAMGAVFGAAGTLLIAAVVMAATFVTNGAQVLGFSRQFYALSCDGLFPRAFGRLHGRWRTPWWSVLLVGGAAIVLALCGNFQVLIRLYFLASYPFYVLAALATVRLRKTRGAPAGYRMPFYPWPIVVFISIAVPVWIAGVRDTPALAVVAAGTLGLSAAAYVPWKIRARRVAARGAV